MKKIIIKRKFITFFLILTSLTISASKQLKLHETSDVTLLDLPSDPLRIIVNYTAKATLMELTRTSKQLQKLTIPELFVRLVKKRIKKEIIYMPRLNQVYAQIERNNSVDPIMNLLVKLHVIRRLKEDELLFKTGLFKQNYEKACQEKRTIGHLYNSSLLHQFINHLYRDFFASQANSSLFKKKIKSLEKNFGVTYRIDQVNLTDIVSLNQAITTGDNVIKLDDYIKTCKIKIQSRAETLTCLVVNSFLITDDVIDPKNKGSRPEQSCF